MAERRALTFESLDEVMPDVERLTKGYTPAGNWTLGQICNHLAMTLNYTVDGFPGKPAPWLLRMTMARLAFGELMKTGKMRPGIKVPETFLPKPGLDDAREIEALRAAVAKFQGHAGEFAPHPFFGQLSREQNKRLHCIHCAHHLSFAVPTSHA